jgi:hypothetical protein
MKERANRLQGATINWRQSGVLADRYLETVLSDWVATLLLLLQAPLLAGMAILVWDNLEAATPSLYFVMVLSCLWIGCMDASREIVKERPLFLRERMVNLEVGAYLLSKVRVLFLLNVVQVACYGGLLAYDLDMRVNLVWLLLDLLLVTVCGTCLGLLISSASSRSDYAVATVPLVILPQILFSEFAIGKRYFEGVSEVIFAFMPSRWGYEALVEFSETDIDYLAAIVRLLPAIGFAAVFLALCYPLLRLKRY